MALRWRRKLLLAKVEANAGTEEALVAADAILARDVEITPLAGETVSRDLERSYYANSGTIHTASHQVLTFKVEFAAAGDADTAPKWGRLLKGCGMAETITATDMPNNIVGDVAYTPVSTGESALTLGLNIDGQLHTLFAARGTWKLTFASNQIPYLEFTFTGNYKAPSSAAAVASPDYTAFRTPIVPSRLNTPTFTIQGAATLPITSLEIDYAAEVVHRELINLTEENIITGRTPAGSLVIDMPAYATFNPVTKAQTSFTGALSVIHGTAAGDKLKIDAPKVQLGAPSFSDQSGVWQATLPLAFTPNTGNDEIKITSQ